MSKYLAYANGSIEVIEAARQGGLDISWIKELSPGADDDLVLAMGCTERLVPLTFDIDLGEMAFRQGKSSVAGVILFRPRLRDSDYLARFAIAVLMRPLSRQGLSA